MPVSARCWPNRLLSCKDSVRMYLYTGAAHGSSRFVSGTIHLLQIGYKPKTPLTQQRGRIYNTPHANLVENNRMDVTGSLRMDFRDFTGHLLLPLCLYSGPIPLDSCTAASFNGKERGGAESSPESIDTRLQMESDAIGCLLAGRMLTGRPDCGRRTGADSCVSGSCMERGCPRKRLANHCTGMDNSK